MDVGARGDRRSRRVDRADANVLTARYCLLPVVSPRPFRLTGRKGISHGRDDNGEQDLLPQDLSNWRLSNSAIIGTRIP